MFTSIPWVRSRMCGARQVSSLVRALTRLVLPTSLLLTIITRHCRKSTKSSCRQNLNKLIQPFEVTSDGTFVLNAENIRRPTSEVTIEEWTAGDVRKDESGGSNFKKEDEDSSRCTPLIKNSVRERWKTSSFAMRHPHSSLKSLSEMELKKETVTTMW